MLLNFVFKRALHFSSSARKWLSITFNFSMCMYVLYVYLCACNQCMVLMYRAAELVGLTVHQLMNDNTAVALNYGVFRRQEFNTSPQVRMYAFCVAIHLIYIVIK